ncbi:MAG: ribonuclease H-like domain-containing protein [Planctomycetota bacterium]|jgi:uncharacterized protein YprB with RNaseH-like and TPR domain
MRLVEKLRRIAAPATGRDEARRVATARLPGACVAGAQGEYWLRRVSLPLEHVHGSLALADIRDTSLGNLAEVARDPELEGLDIGRAFFFDTETTSLGGGAGTYVFLVGLGYFRADAFVVEQYFLSEMMQERAMLDAIGRRCAEFDLVVSFHGKGFDTPRLLDRLAFHRMRSTLPASHLDLCLVGRGLYRGAFEDCRLQTFERELVGFERTDDLPGAECPRAFFSHLRGDSHLIPRVFEHNLYDVLTLPAVAARIARETAAPAHPVVLSNLGAFYESTGHDRMAREIYTAALAGLRRARHPLLARSLERLALLERRAGRHDESARLLHERRDLPPCAFQPLEDLAKYYEHRARDLGRAQETALDARSRLVTGKIQVDIQTRERYLHSLDHRLDRLRRRRGLRA